MASAPNFYATGTIGNLTLSASAQVITTGQASGSDIVVMSVVNLASTAKTITISDSSDNDIGVINLPASAGTTAALPPLNLMQPGFGMAGLEPNASGGYSFYLPSGLTLKARLNNITGGAARIYWKRKDC